MGGAVLTGWALHAWIAAIAFGGAPVAGRVIARQPGASAWPAAFFWATADTGLLLACLATRHWADACTAAAGIAVALGSDWWRRNGKRAARALGSKALAVLNGMLGRLRDAVVPVPEGARA